MPLPEGGHDAQNVSRVSNNGYERLGQVDGWMRKMELEAQVWPLDLVYSVLKFELRDWIKEVHKELAVCEFTLLPLR